MVECQLPKLDVAGSNPVSRSKINNLRASADVLSQPLLHNSLGVITALLDKPSMPSAP